MKTLECAMVERAALRTSQSLSCETKRRELGVVALVVAVTPWIPLGMLFFCNYNL